MGCLKIKEELWAALTSKDQSPHLHPGTNDAEIRALFKNENLTRNGEGLNFEALGAGPNSIS